MRKKKKKKKKESDGNVICELNNGKDVLDEAQTKRLLLKFREDILKFFRHIQKRETIKRLVTTGRIEGKRASESQEIKVLNNTTKWLGQRRNTTSIRATMFVKYGGDYHHTMLPGTT